MVIKMPGWKSRRQSLLGAGILSFAYTLWGFALVLVTTPILIHGLGLAAYGVYSLAFSVAGFGSYLDFGLGWTVSKFVAEADAQKNECLLTAVVRSAFLYNVAVGLLFIAVILPSAGWIAHSLLRFSAVESGVMAQVLRLAAISFLFSSIGGGLVSTLRGLQRFDTATLIAAATLTVAMSGAAVAARLGFGVLVAASLQLLGTVFGLALGLWACHGLLWNSAPTVPVTRQLRTMLAFSTWNYMTRLIQMLATEVDKVLVGRFAGPAMLVFYNVPFSLGQKINFVAGPAVTAIYPKAAAGRYESDSFMKQYFSGSRLVYVVTGAAAIAVFLWGDCFLGAWIGPEMARQGTFFVRVFAIGFWFVSVGSFDGGCIEGWNHPRVTFAISAIAFAMAVALAVVTTPLVGTIRAIALGVGGYLSFAGVGQIILWQSISKYPVASSLRQIVLPLAEMVVLGLTLALILKRIVSARLLVMGALPAIAAALMLWGTFRSFNSGERRAIMIRLTSFGGAKA
jgi:O-antigen/teichoic acid export membrane protein